MMQSLLQASMRTRLWLGLLKPSQAGFADLQFGVASRHNADVARRDMVECKQALRPLRRTQPRCFLLSRNCLQQQFLHLLSGLTYALIAAWPCTVLHEAFFPAADNNS